MLVNAEGKAFVGKRIDNKEGDWWQMPQGGVDPGEDLDKAMLRELREEIGAGKKHMGATLRWGAIRGGPCKRGLRQSLVGGF